MKAELKHLASVSAARLRARVGWRDIVFTVADARRALPYVAQIAADAAEAFQIVQRCREDLGQIAVIADRPRKAALCEQRDIAFQRLNRAIDDCNAVGAHLVDLASGVVSLPGLVEDRPVCLLWTLGDSTDAAWLGLTGAALADSSARL